MNNKVAKEPHAASIVLNRVLHRVTELGGCDVVFGDLNMAGASLSPFVGASWWSHKCGWATEVWLGEREHGETKEWVVMQVCSGINHTHFFFSHMLSLGLRLAVQCPL